ncbi:hypothetical protein [Flavobacterium limi]|uniref:Uncharacterized protein n=1 Tax=Flavobacterium limi TaxID=2045105 RepID=A0ABQ1TX05_9FLAO|nr:hypothetical protein [Flavobacterium limi]GGF05878.1 hypothetical protein GCM10011518_13890 [Flavobacterium limi]
MDKVNLQRLRKTLDYLQSKQRELKRQYPSDTRSIDSMIKYLKKDMIERFKLIDYDELIKQEIKDTETFTGSVQKIIDINSYSK